MGKKKEKERKMMIVEEFVDSSCIDFEQMSVAKSNGERKIIIKERFIKIIIKETNINIYKKKIL